MKVKASEMISRWANLSQDLHDTEEEDDESFTRGPTVKRA